MSNREFVIVVDDDLAMLSAVARVLKQHGYDTNLFASAEAFKGHNDYERVSCIILDVNLNDGSGIELRRGLKVAGPRVSRKAVLGEVPDRVAQASTGGLS